MNVLQILPSLDIGGVETGTLDLAKYLVKDGHKAVTVSAGGRLVRELDAINARHYNLPVGKKSILNIILVTKQLCDIIRREGIDIVHARSRVPALAGYMASKITNRIFITTAHGYYKKHFLSTVMGWGKFVIVASNIMAKHMVGDFGTPYERIRLIPRGADLDKFTFRSPSTRQFKDFTIGMVSRITPLKGHADFIKAVSLLRRHIPKLKALIVGDAPKSKYKEDLDLLVRRFGLANIVEFAPATKDVPSVMNRLNVLVSATVTPEAFGRVIIEAHAVGVPVVATSVGGVVDIIEDDRTGLLCSPQDPKDMSEKLLRFYRDPKLCESLALAGRKRVESDFNLQQMMDKTLAVYKEALERKNILVVKISAIGDVILSIPSLRAIRRKFPAANIKVLVGLGAREVLYGCPYIDDRIVCDFKGRHKGLFGLWRLGSELRKECFETVIDLQNNRKSHILALLSLAPVRYGYDNGKLSFLLNRKIKDDAPHLDPLDHQFRTLKLAGVKAEDKRLELWPSFRDDEKVSKFLEDNWVKPGQDLVGIHVRASMRWATKNWPTSYIAELCDMLAKNYNIRVVLTGAKSDSGFVEEIVKMTKSKPVVAVGKTDIMELASLIKRFKVYLTPDSAPMHIASGVGTPFVALFGPTDAVRHLAPSDDCIVMCKSQDLGCGPCYSPSCTKNLKCMKRITVEEVFGQMKKFLKGGA